MGTRFEIIVWSSDSLLAGKALDAAYAAIASLDQRLSDYNPDSELSRLSFASGSPTPVAVSQDLFRVLRAALNMAEESGGAFDPTVGALSRLWRRGIRRQTVPDSAAVLYALQTVGYRDVDLDSQTTSVRLSRSGARLDLGGIAKGYAADRALEILRSSGIGSALVDAGGDIVTGDPPPGKYSWTLSIPSLDDDGKIVSAPLSAANRAVAMSGDAYRYIETDSLRFSHIINPGTGFGLTNNRLVVAAAPDGATADALASALSVIVLEKAPGLLAAYPDAGAVVLTRTNERWSRLTLGNWK